MKRIFFTICLGVMMLFFGCGGDEPSQPEPPVCFDNYVGYVDVYSGWDRIGITQKLNRYKFLLLYFNEEFAPVYINTFGEISIGQVLYFESEDCVGGPYFFYAIELPWIFRLIPQKGKVFDHKRALYFYEAGEVNAYKKTMLSQISGNDCSNGGTPGLFLRLKPNDPAKTGIIRYPFSPPIKIEDFPNINIISE